MSEVIKVTGYRELSHVVKHNGNDKYYMVDSNDTPYRGYETMIFLWDAEEDDVFSWGDLYVELHGNYTEMEKRHYYICENIEEFV